MACSGTQAPPPATTCDEGGSTHRDGTAWTCADGCSACACVDGALVKTKLACDAAIETCSEGGRTHTSGTIWTCEDGCSKCSCYEGVVTRVPAACPDAADGG